MKRALIFGGFLLFLGGVLLFKSETSSQVKPIEIQAINEENLQAKTNEIEMMNTLVKASKDERKEDSSLDTYDAMMLMKIAMAEAEGEGVEGKAMVMAVILNRVKSDDFENAIDAVIFEKTNGVYQFSPLADGRFNEVKPDTECHLALAAIERGEYDDIDALYFENKNLKDTWQSKNCEYLYTVGNHKFYK